MTGTIAWLSRTSQERGKGVEMGRRSLAIHKGLSQVSADWQDKVMHGSLTVGEQVLMGGDVAPDRYEEPRGFSLSLQIQSTTEAERIFHELGKDGRVAVPLEKTFWAARFGMVVDRFGIPWLINCEGSDEPPEG